VNPSIHASVRSSRLSNHRSRRFIFRHPALLITLVLMAALLAAAIGGPIAGAVAATFGAKTDFVTGSGPFSVAVGDFNGDGKRDLAVANENSNTVSLLLNNTPPTPTITPSGSTSFCESGTLTSSSATGNQWYKDTVLLAGETNQTLNVTACGSYTVTVTDTSCASSPSAATTVTVNPSSPTPPITPTPAQVCANSTGNSAAGPAGAST
jgi:MFS family permease